MASKRRDTRKRTRGPELDPNNPNNWTSTELKEKLALLGIKISENFTNKQLKRIFLDNKKSSPESSDRIKKSTPLCSFEYYTNKIGYGSRKLY